MRQASLIEQHVADAIPHDAECWAWVSEPGWRCACGADSRRARLLLHVGNHVDKLTRGKVYLDGTTPAAHAHTSDH